MMIKQFKRGVVLAVMFQMILGVQAAQAANLFFSPGIGKFSSSFNVGVYVSSPTESSNAFSGTISFPKDKLRVISLSRAGSIVNFWAQEPTYSNTDGTIVFEGVTFNAFQGAAGELFSVTFGVVSLGSASLAFTRSQILANDGNGTDITKPALGASFTLVEAPPVPPVPPSVKPSTTPPPAAASPVKPVAPTITEYSEVIEAEANLPIAGTSENGREVFIFIQREGEFNPQGGCGILPADAALKSGDTGEQVTALQNFLADNVSLPREALVTGTFGNKTFSTLALFQEKYRNLIYLPEEKPAFGYLNPQTVQVINELSCGFLKELELNAVVKDGEFRASLQSGLEPGQYRVWVKAYSAGLFSEPSNIVTLNVSPRLPESVWPYFWSEILKFAFLAIFLILLIVPPASHKRPTVLTLQQVIIYGMSFFMFGMVFSSFFLMLSPAWCWALGTVATFGIAYVWVSERWNKGSNLPEAGSHSQQVSAAEPAASKENAGGSGIINSNQ